MIDGRMKNFVLKLFQCMASGCAIAATEWFQGEFEKGFPSNFSRNPTASWESGVP